MSSSFPPRFVRTKQDAQQTIAAYEACKEAILHAGQELADALKPVKPPFKCVDCKRTIELAAGFRLGKDEVCEQCATASFLRGYEQLKRSEALTGKSVLSDMARNFFAQLSTQKRPEVN